MSEIEVEFTIDDEDQFIQTEDTPEFPIKVEVANMLFEKQGGNLENMTEKDKEEFDKFIDKVSPTQAVEEAIAIISTAPAFDNTNVDEVMRDGVVVNVNYLDVKNV